MYCSRWKELKMIICQNYLLYMAEKSTYWKTVKPYIPQSKGGYVERILIQLAVFTFESGSLQIDLLILHALVV